MTPPAPLEWHPWYCGKTYLLDWLAHGTQNTYLVPVPRRRVQFVTELSAYPDAIVCAALVKRRAAAPAPYIGNPFVYTWWAATDQYGRSIASDTQIRYLP